MALTLRQILPPTRSGRTMFAAWCVLGAFALVQLTLLGVYFARNGARRSASGPAVSVSAGAGAPAPAIHFAESTEPTMPSGDSLALPPAAEPAAPTPAGAASSSRAAAIPNSPVLPGPAPMPAQSGSTAISGAIAQARALRQQGDMREALGRLREALVTEPDNPQAIAEMGITYEAMQLSDQAFEQWHRLYNMGESIGALYNLADTKLHGAPNANTAGVPADRANTQDNAVLKITDIHTEDIPDPSVEKKLALKIVVKGRPGVVIDPDKVKIEAYFYDLLDGKDVVQTDAQTDYAWLTPPPINWANDKSEVLEAMYVRPRNVPLMPSSTAGGTAAARSKNRNGKNSKVKAGPAGTDAAADAAASPAESAGPPPVRTYLGYTVRLYYDRQLQDVQADPVRLLQQFQPPLTLPAD